ncbi:prepilin-type N-terminal cleavage/methylation domain-containing protein [Desulfurivibrio sp. D14AmB]|uniref:type IV pilus modification PilV family protein n=1 Tax=Desulfurivibrio sp. D14AmB TaxID=3374370 RepID=UPI00376F319A
MKTNRAQQGFTLIEIMIALVLLSVGILAAASMQISALGGNHLANRISAAAALAEATIEELALINAQKIPNQIPYNDHPWLEANSDIADLAAAETAKLGDTPNALAELLAAAHQPDQQPVDFTIFWNVVEDYPLPDSKTIRVTVLRDDLATTIARRTDFVMDFIIMKPF